MVLQIREHIELRGNDPLDVVVVGTSNKAYLVANLALKDGPQVAADHYGIGLASVHAAITYYYDNEAAIHEAIQSARDLSKQLGARSGQAALNEIKNRGNHS